MSAALQGPRSALISTAQLVREPSSSLLKWRAQYGDPFLLPTLNGPVVFTGRPELVRQIFNAPAHFFAPFEPDAMAPVVGTGSLLSATGTAHRQQRRAIAPGLVGNAMPFWTRQIRALTQAQIAQAGAQIDPRATFMDAALEVVERLIFGAPDPEFSRLLRAMLSRIHPSFLFSTKRRLNPLYLHYARASKALDAALFARIKAAKARAQEPAMLSAMVHAKDPDGQDFFEAQQIRDQLRLLLIAGHETTATAQAWVAIHLAAHPQVQDQLRAELQAAPKPASKGLLAAVVDETLRRSPVVREVLREVAQPLVLGAHTLPVGTGVAASVWLAHNAACWGDPRAWRPERFLKGTLTPGSYFPFGGGARRCIGAALALTQLRVTTAEWLKQGRFVALEPLPVDAERHGVIFGPPACALGFERDRLG